MRRILSGIQPSGVLHLGNYLGALKNWVALQEDPGNECLYCVVDLHAITTPQKTGDLRRNILGTAALCLAAGVDPKRSVLFMQSDVPEHSELAWILQCHAYMGELRRMTQFKDKGGEQEAAGAGLFTYPVLMAADILLYDAAAVPVGEDQQQHLELARTLARRLNNQHGPLFRVPEPIIPEAGARVMGLDDPSVKMSKSASSAANWIALDEPPESVKKKFKSAVTDSGREVRFDPKEKAAISNLLAIYSLVSGASVPELEARYAGKGYGEFKTDLGEAVSTFLAPIRERHKDWSAREDDLRDVLADGARRARELARPMLEKVKAVLGLGARKEPAPAGGRKR